MDRILDHLTVDGRTSLCGLLDEELPEPPLCETCARIADRRRQWTLRMRGAGLVHQEPVARR